MSRLLTTENLKLATVAVFCLLLAWTGPSIAHGVHAQFAHNADKVDGKHAVGAGASLANAKGKLVAHDAGGRIPTRFLPPSVVTEAEYDDRLGTRVIAAGKIAANGSRVADHAEVGDWTPSRNAAGQYFITFNNPAMCPRGGGAITWPTATVSPAASDAVPFTGGLQCQHATGNVSVEILTPTASGNLADRAFTFTIYGV